MTPKFDHLPKRLTELRETCTYVHWFIIKDTAQEQLNGGGAQGKVRGKGQELPRPLRVQPPPQHLDVFANPKCSPNPILQGFCFFGVFWSFY